MMVLPYDILSGPGCCWYLQTRSPPAWSGFVQLPFPPVVSLSLPTYLILQDESCSREWSPAPFVMSRPCSNNTVTHRLKRLEIIIISKDKRGLFFLLKIGSESKVGHLVKYRAIKLAAGPIPWRPVKLELFWPLFVSLTFSLSLKLGCCVVTRPLTFVLSLVVCS